MKKILFIALLLGACAGTPQTRATDALAIACDAYATALDNLTPMKSKGYLTAETIKAIDMANKKVSVVCLPGSVVDPASAVTLVQNAITFLRTVRESI